LPQGILKFFGLFSFFIISSSQTIINQNFTVLQLN